MAAISQRRQTGCGIAAILTALSLVLSGCTGPGQWLRNGFKVGPNYATPSAATAEHWIDADNPRIKSLEGNNARWWTAFNDPILDYLVTSAANENLTLKTAGCRILEARAERGIASGNLLPQQQGMSGGYSRNALGNGYPFNMFDMGHYYDNSTVGFNAAWELDFWGRFRRAIRSGRRKSGCSVCQL